MDSILFGLDQLSPSSPLRVGIRLNGWAIDGLTRRQNAQVPDFDKESGTFVLWKPALWCSPPVAARTVRHPPMAPIIQPPKPSRRLLRQPPQRSLRKPQARHHPSPRTHQDRHSRHGRRRRRQPSPRSKLCPTANHPGQTEARPPQTRRHRRLCRHLPPRRRSQRPTRRLTRTPNSDQAATA